MNHEDELVLDIRSLRRNKNQQADLVTRYCAEAEERVRNARSMAEVERIAKEMCDKFSNECSGDVLRGALIRRISEMAKKQWGQNNNYKGTPCTNAGLTLKSIVSAHRSELHCLKWIA